MISEVTGPFAAGNGQLSKLLGGGPVNNEENEPIDYEISGLSEEYKQNARELADMKRKFYAEHPLPGDSIVGTIGLTQTSQYKARDAEWARIEAQYLAEHPISEADKAIIEKELKRYATFMSLG
ncbi:MAG: hypothetical protein K6E29_06060 [Cyanobacteria bacterium RUI128]|nr:hypothetical protein [Cyanobacteria bacterium RUI128]